jgi:hypothetical protein
MANKQYHKGILNFLRARIKTSLDTRHVKKSDQNDTTICCSKPDLFLFSLTIGKVILNKQ